MHCFYIDKAVLDLEDAAQLNWINLTDKIDIMIEELETAKLAKNRYKKRGQEKKLNKMRSTLLSCNLCQMRKQSQNSLTLC